MKTSKARPSDSLNVKRLTVYLDPLIDEQVRRLADLEDRSISTVAERAFRAYISMATPQLIEDRR